MLAMDSMPATTLIATLPMMWLLGLFLQASMGGWRRFAAFFPESRMPAGQTPEVERFNMATVWFGKDGSSSLGSTHAGVAIVELGEAGIRVSAIALFRPFHPSFFVPWSAVAGCTRDRFVLLDRTFLDLVGCPMRLRFTDPVGAAVLARFEAGGRGAPRVEKVPHF
jgi:hypothetical protein